MERRTIIIIVAVALGAIGYLIFRPKTDPVVVTPPASPIAVAKVPTIDIKSGVAPDGYTATISAVGGGLKHVNLAREQYYQHDRLEKLSEKSKALVSAGLIDPAKFREGPYDLVGTWSPAYYPFALEFDVLGWTKSKTNAIERLVRSAAPAVADSKDPKVLTLTSATPEDLRIQPGDVAIDAQGTEQPILEVREDKVISLAKALGAGPVRVVRRGTPAEQYRKDATYTVVASAPGEATLVWPSPFRDTSEMFLERRWRTIDGFTLHHELRILNLGRDALESKVRLAIHGWEDPWAEPPGMFTPPAAHWAPNCFSGGEKHEEAATSLVSEEPKVEPGVTRWLGVNSQYFLLAAIFDGEEGVQGLCRLRGQANGVITASFERETSDFAQGGLAACVPKWSPVDKRNGAPTCEEAMAKLGADPGHLDSASLDRNLDAYKGPREEAVQLRAMVEGYSRQTANTVLAFRVFAGPKDLAALQAVDPTLEKNLDFWIVGFLAKPMLWLLNSLHAAIPIWWLSIFLLTVIVRLVMLPLTHRQALSMQKMQDLKPELEELQKKYAADKPRLQTEMMNLYKRAGVNPLGGCLPIFLQMPVYIALYRCIYTAVDLFQAPLFGWVTDMTQADPYYILPVCLGLFMVVQQRFMPQSPGADPMQQKIMQIVMPIMFSVFMLVLPAGLVFYIFVSTAIGVLQSWWIKRKFGGKMAVTRGRA